MSESILITGGMGYLGGRLAQVLTECPGRRVRLGVHRRPQTDLDWLPRAEVVPIDLESGGGLEQACRGVSNVVHLAALDAAACVDDPERAVILNTLGTLRLIRAAERNGVGRFVYFSTAHVYGSPLQGRIDEETIPRPFHPYATTHRAAEDFVLAAHRSGKLVGLVTRLSNGVGAPAHSGITQWSLAANDFCRQAVTTGRIVLRSSGLQCRDFAMMSDIGLALLHLLDLPRGLCGDGLFNLGGEKPMRVVDLAKHVAARCERVLAFRPEVVCPSPVRGEATNSIDYRIDRLKATGYQPRASVSQEIDDTLLFCIRVFGGTQ